jgi:Chromo (CHRromatin Organisation MOdifier) domain
MNELDEDSFQYEVEQVLAMKIEDSKKMYLIKWLGYSTSQNSWEPLENLECVDLIKEFDMKKEPKDDDKKSIKVG